MKLLRGKRSKPPTEKKGKTKSLTARGANLPASALRGDVQPISRGGAGVDRSGSPRGIAGPAPRSDQFRGGGRIRRPGGSASVGGGREGPGEGGEGEARASPRPYNPGRHPVPSCRPRRSPRQRALPFGGAGGVAFGAARSPPARSGRLTQRLRPTRLETRTKESNVHASRVVKETKPSFSSPSEGGKRWNAQ